jgi:hypothetical protein
LVFLVHREILVARPGQAAHRVRLVIQDQLAHPGLVVQPGQPVLLALQEGRLVLPGLLDLQELLAPLEARPEQQDHQVLQDTLAPQGLEVLQEPVVQLDLG